MKELSFFRMPLLWLFLGPPAFRNLGSRGATASMEGDNDIWNYLRLVWWLFWGIVAFIELYRQRHLLPDYIKRLGKLPALVVGFLGAVFASCAVSPTPLYSLVMAVMLTLMVTCALDFSLKVYTGAISIRRANRIILLLSLLLLGTVFYLYKTNPLSNVAVDSFFDQRVRGGTVAYAPLLSLVAIFMGAHYLLNGRRPLPRILSVGVILFGLHMLSLGQTRSSYLGFFIGLFVFVSVHWRVWRNAVLLGVGAALVITFLSTVLFSYDYAHGVRWRLDQYYKRYVLRDKWAVQDAEFAKQNLGSLNGRSEVFFILAEHAFWKPLGLGHIAGPRVMLSQMIEGLPGAHNAYTEIWAGSGILGFLSWVGTVLFVFFRGRHLWARDALPVRVLMPILMTEGMFESDMVYMFVQSSVLFWIVAALIMAMTSRQQRDAFAYARGPKQEERCAVLA